MAACEWLLLVWSQVQPFQENAPSKTESVAELRKQTEELFSNAWSAKRVPEESAVVPIMKKAVALVGSGISVQDEKDACILALTYCEALPDSAALRRLWDTAIRKGLKCPWSTTAAGDEVVRWTWSVRSPLNDLAVGALTWCASDDVLLSETGKSLAIAGVVWRRLLSDWQGIPLSDADVADAVQRLLILKTKYASVPSPQLDSRRKSMKDWADWASCEIQVFRLGARFPSITAQEADGAEVGKEPSESVGDGKRWRIIDVLGFSGIKKEDLAFVHERLKAAAGDVVPEFTAVITHEGVLETVQSIVKEMRKDGWAHIVFGRALDKSGRSVSDILNVPPTNRLFLIDPRGAIRWKSSSPQDYFGNAAIEQALRQFAAQ